MITEQQKDHPAPSQGRGGAAVSRSEELPLRASQKEISPENIKRAEKLLSAIGLPSSIEKLPQDYPNLSRQTDMTPETVARALQDWENANFIVRRFAKSAFEREFSEKKLIGLADQAKRYQSEMTRIRESRLRETVHVYGLKTKSGEYRMASEGGVRAGDEIASASGGYDRVSAVMTRERDILKVEFTPLAYPGSNPPKPWTHTTRFVSWNRDDLESSLRSAIGERWQQRGITLTKQEEQILDRSISVLGSAEGRRRIRDALHQINAPKDLDKVQLGELVK